MTNELKRYITRRLHPAVVELTGAMELGAALDTLSTQALRLAQAVMADPARQATITAILAQRGLR